MTEGDTPPSTPPAPTPPEREQAQQEQNVQDQQDPNQQDEQHGDQQDARSYRPVTPRMGGIQQQSEDMWTAWTGGKPLSG